MKKHTLLWEETVADGAGNTFDIVILGGGSGGYACALRAVQLGKSVALIEKSKLGGTCLHWGCIPTKALLHSAEVADLAREGEAFGIKSTFDGIDMAQVNKYKDGVIDRLYKGLQGLIKSGGITVVEGEGKLVSKDTVEVNGQRYTGTNVVLATGSVSRTLGLEIGGRVITSTEALTMTEVPEKVVIIGGSVIGVEFASVWKSFGADVTIIEGLPTLVPLEDPALSKGLERAFRKRKINFKTGVKFDSVKQTDNGVTVTLENGDTIETDLVLVAVGRGPNSAGMGYEEVGVTVDRGWVPTNERLATNVEGVFAVGDLVPGLQLAHRGFAHGIFVAEEIAGLNPQVVVDSGIPRVTYCEPEIASVGITEPQAREKYGDDNVETVEYNLGGNGKSQILGTAGTVKLVREKDGPIVGVHMLGSRFGEQVGEASLMVNWEAYPEDVAQFIHAHPTQNEALGEAALALAGKPLHSHA
ncbi:dihydrolipoyl dehydrogenase [Aeromicrobium fastidiosum]|uniref:Dihydrolipoyl dehydrogenase n=1 Tax=Aeromicrobium fastidiosum TaxID=52699 RepID=A0A641AMW9_9ACTN|nr:dihydrolipoyl dehydrogenase [Aeromicrobium fastidiosum]KAA1378628.1 dihydrolipoyl dehydrogenase [Aeromicrobium fastidiosum]MBP2392392.1 dihydrolipoamide dehydrogenase [Aeromicrobium fastidiosum]